MQDNRFRILLIQPQEITFPRIADIPLIHSLKKQGGSVTAFSYCNIFY